MQGIFPKVYREAAFAGAGSMFPLHPKLGEADMVRIATAVEWVMGRTAA